MKYANQITEIINAFSPEPLQSDQMDAFYCNDTMEYRMSDKYSSPIEDIYEMCQETGGHTALPRRAICFASEYFLPIWRSISIP